MTANAVTEYEFEPIPGLPERLPAGETLLWQGSPRWDLMARRAFHVRGLGCYFAAILAWRVVSERLDGGSLADTVWAGLSLLPLAVAALGILTLLAWLIARTTIYTLTSRRLVMRFGVALPMMINIPFSRVKAAGIRSYADGSGDIALTLNERDRIAYLQLWPHVRPWRFARPEPMLRALPDADAVAGMLARALHERRTAVAANPDSPPPTQLAAA